MEQGSVKSFIIDGGRLSNPPGCPTWLSELMQNCWLAEPAARPVGIPPTTAAVLFTEVRVACLYSIANYECGVVKSFAALKAQLGPHITNRRTLPGVDPIYKTRESYNVAYNAGGGGHRHDTAAASDAQALPGKTVGDSELQLRLIPRECVTVTTKLGQGSFGIVSKAIVKEFSSHVDTGRDSYVAAAKMVLETAPETAEDDLVQEAKLMARIPPHCNVVGLVGLVESGSHGHPPPILLVQFCEHASLKAYLVQSSPQETSVGFKLAAGRDIAYGMAHLCRHHVIHRDLAARNVLVDSRLTMKVADFGFARPAKLPRGLVLGNGHDGYYDCVTTHEALRWTAPEALESQRYTIKSDVWSFGITMVEIFLDGNVPRPGPAGTPTRPSKCPDAEFTFLSKCFSKNPNIRPTFEVLADTLEMSLKKLAVQRIPLDTDGYVDQNTPLQATLTMPKQSAVQYDEGPLPVPPFSNIAQFSDDMINKAGYYQIAQGAGDREDPRIEAPTKSYTDTEKHKRKGTIGREALYDFEAEVRHVMRLLLYSIFLHKSSRLEWKYGYSF